MIKKAYQMSFIYGAGQESIDMPNSEIYDRKNIVMKADTLVSHAEPKIGEYAGSKYFSHILDVWSMEDLYEDSAYGFEQTDSLILGDKFEILSWACGQIALCPTGSSMLFEAMDDGWSLALEDLNGPDFHIDVPEKMIVLDNGGLLLSALGRSEYFRNILLVSLVRALRDVWQEARHGGFDEDYAPQDILVLERARAADLDVLAVMVAWELRGEGFGSLWRHMIGSEDGDIAMCYSATLERNPASAFNGYALAMAFKQWYKSESRVKSCEHEALNDIDALLQERGSKDAFGTANLNASKIEELSALPDQNQYLCGFGENILLDEDYAGMSDMVNQAHYRQIMHDMSAVRVHGIPFRDASLAEKIFPNGEFTPEGQDPCSLI